MPLLQLPFSVLNARKQTRAPMTSLRQRSKRGHDLPGGQGRQWLNHPIKLVSGLKGPQRMTIGIGGNLLVMENNEATTAAC